MKLKNVICFVFCCSVAASCVSANADCGKMWIYPYDWGNYWGGQHSYPQPVAGSATTTPNYQGVQQVPVIINNNNNNQQLAEIESLRNELNDLREIIKYIKDSGLLTPTDPPDSGNGGSGGSTQPLPPEPPLPDPDPDPQPGPEDGEGEGTVPPPYEPASGGASNLGATFNEPAQRAVIAWNGRADGKGRETLVLTTNEESVNGKKGVLLSVMPLPGKPIDVRPANNNTFAQAKALFFSRTPQKIQGGASGLGFVMAKKIGAHNIFVWELDNVSTFQRDVQSWVAKKFNNGAAALITDETVNVLKWYFKRGFRYFAFDLTEVGKESTKQAIAYTFVSTHIYYPLVVSRIGGSNKSSTVDLIVMTPKDVSLTINGAITDAVPTGEPAYGANQCELVRGGSVSFTIDEVRKLDKSLDVFDKETKYVRVRNFKFTKPLNSYKNDFTAVADKK